MGGFPNCGKEENSVQTCALRSRPRSHERAGVVVQTRGMSLDHQMWQSPPGGGREGRFLAGYILSLLDHGSPTNLNSEHVQVPSSEAATVPVSPHFSWAQEWKLWWVWGNGPQAPEGFPPWQPSPQRRPRWRAQYQQQRLALSIRDSKPRRSGGTEPGRGVILMRYFFHPPLNTQVFILQSPKVMSI